MKIILFLISFSAFGQDFLINHYKKTFVKQKGLFICWAASIEAVDKFYDKKTDQIELVKSEAERSNILFNTVDKDSPLFAFNVTAFAETYLRKTTEIKPDEIEKTLKTTQRPIIYMAQNHVSLIIGYNDMQYITMDTRIGNISKVAKTHLNKLLIGADYPARFFLK